MTNFYVYYRVEERNVEAVARLVESLFKTVKENTRIEGKWLRRRDDPSTYMEVYEGVADGKAFEALLERETATFGLPRKTETFVDVPDRPRLAR
jgi:hypothetical protein